MFLLDERLSVCASLVREGARLADIGTDHAYLPVWLAKNGKISSAVAADVRVKPLRSGEENINRYGCSDIVATRLSDGLDEILPDEADDIVIAGMGGELIVKIISRAKWLENPEKRLILQPMTKACELRRYLCENGFEIISETPCSHGGKFYSVMHVRYTGEVKSRMPAYYYTGELHPADPLSIEYMKRVIRKLVKKRNGTALGGGDVSCFEDVICNIKEKFGVDENDCH